LYVSNYENYEHHKPNFKNWVDTDSNLKQKEYIFDMHRISRRDASSKLTLDEVESIYPAGTGKKKISIPAPHTLMLGVVNFVRTKVFNTRELNALSGLNLASYPLRHLRRFILNGVRCSTEIKWFGFTPFPVTRDKPGKVHGVNEHFLGFVNSEFWKDDFGKVSNMILNSAWISGSWDYYAGHYFKFFHYRSHTVKPFRLIRLFAKYGSELHLPKVESIHAKDIEFLRIKYAANPGILSKRLTNKKKGEFATVAIEAAKLMWYHIGKHHTADVSLWSFGSRVRKESKLFIADDEGNSKVAQARVIMMQEYVPSLINMNYANTLTTLLMDNDDSCIKIGKSAAKGGYVKLREPYLKYDKVLEGDWSEFDQSVKRPHIVVAMAILRQCFPSGDEHDKRFMYMLSGLVCKKVVSPGGLIFELANGIPSGSPWTSLLDSIVNWLVLRDLVETCVTGCNKKDVGFQIGGDDFCIFLPKGAHLDLEKLVKRADEYHGMTLRGEDLVLKDTFVTEASEAASFYKTCFVNGLPSIRFDDILKRLMIPERYPRSCYDAYRHLNDQMNSGIVRFGIAEEFCVSYYVYLSIRMLSLEGRSPPSRIINLFSTNARLIIKDAFEEVLLTSPLPHVHSEEELWKRDEKGIYYSAEIAKNFGSRRECLELLDFTLFTKFSH
jgi:hypothetical protein